MSLNDEEVSFDRESAADVTQASTIPCSSGFGADSGFMLKFLEY